MQVYDFIYISMLARNWLLKLIKNKCRIQRGHAMKWVEIITLRSPSKINGQFIEELLKGAGESESPNDTPKHLVEIKVYHHSVVETDLSIHIYWRSEAGRQDKSPLGLRLSSALKTLGLLNHSVWVEKSAQGDARRSFDITT